MRNVIICFLTGYAVIRCLETFWRRPKIAGKIFIPGSLPLIVGAYVALFLVVFWELTYWLANPVSLWLAAMGWLLIGLATVGRNWAIRSLGPYHSIHIEIREQHALVRSGPYQYVRNPYYLSNFIEAIGLVLVANARWALVIAVGVYFPLLIHRLVHEEVALCRKFGNVFESYKRDVSLILPSGIHATKTWFTVFKLKETSVGSNK